MTHRLIATSAVLLLGAPGLASALTFGQADTDNNGVVTQQEYEAAVPPTSERAFIRLDADGDGKVSLAEVEAIDPQNRYHTDYRAMDLDRNSAISHSEYETWRRSSADAYFVAADIDQDGQLSHDEVVILDERQRADVNFDGVLTTSEYAEWRGDATEAEISAVDTNGDGEVSLGEMAAVGPREDQQLNYR